MSLPLWERDEGFLKSHRLTTGITLVDTLRCYMLYQFVRATADLPGDIAEVGVYKGGTARLIVDASRGRKVAIRLFDTFAGLPSTADPARDIHKVGGFSDTNADSVAAMFAQDPRVSLHVGYFPDSAERDSLAASNYSFVHVDVDIFRSVLDCANWFYPRLCKGGVLVFDDYGFPSCPGAKLAVDEFFATKPDRPIYLPTGQCIVLKQ